MGDAEDDVETNSKITWEDIDVLKVGHHGSDTSSTEQFINKVLPEMAVISVNSNTNSYGHPSETVIKRLQDKECEIYRTDMNGTILLINENGTNKLQMLDTKVNAGKYKKGKKWELNFIEHHNIIVLSKNVKQSITFTNKF